MKYIGKALSSIFTPPQSESDIVRLMRTEYKKEYSYLKKQLGRMPNHKEAETFLNRH